MLVCDFQVLLIVVVHEFLHRVLHELVERVELLTDKSFLLKE
jgi:hypothetical protein